MLSQEALRVHAENEEVSYYNTRRPSTDNQESTPDRAGREGGITENDQSTILERYLTNELDRIQSWAEANAIFSGKVPTSEPPSEAVSRPRTPRLGLRPSPTPKYRSTPRRLASAERRVTFHHGDDDDHQIPRQPQASLHEDHPVVQDEHSVYRGANPDLREQRYLNQNDAEENLQPRVRYYRNTEPPPPPPTVTSAEETLGMRVKGARLQGGPVRNHRQRRQAEYRERQLPPDSSSGEDEEYSRRRQPPRRRRGEYSANSRPKMQPKRYDGKGPWEDYRIHFETVANINGWDDEDRAHFLLASLDDEARSSLVELNQQGKLDDYGAIVDVLAQDFGNQNRAPVYRAELRTRRRREGETISDLARSFRRLATLAYPDTTYELRETLAMENFVDALDTGTALAIYQAQASTLNHASKIASELEAFRVAERRKHQPRKFARAVVPEQQDQQDGTEMLKELLAELKSLRDQRMLQQGRGTDGEQTGQGRYQRRPPGAAANGEWRRGRPDFERRDLSSIECYNCRKMGHFQSNCQEPRRDRQQPRGASPVQGNF